MSFRMIRGCIVVGGGAAGMMAACTAASLGAKVLLIEKNEKLGKKLYITGKGRCNFSNACGGGAFMENVIRNPRFMYSSLKAFSPDDMAEFLLRYGCRTKTERGRRMFPESDHASDVTRALKRCMDENKVEMLLGVRVLSIGRLSGKEEGARFALNTEAANGKKEVFKARSLIIATGGLSYPSTGSTGDGFAWASKMGLKVTPGVPSLVSLNVSEEGECRALKGVPLRNVSFKVRCNGKKAYESPVGEMLFTDKGLSGPLALTASAYICRGLSEGEKYMAAIDLKPGLSREKLDERLLRDLTGNPNQSIKNALSGLTVSALLPVLFNRAGIFPDKKAREVTRAERMSLCGTIKGLSYTITGSGGFDEAVITSGGVSATELDPGSMRSKKYDGLYFAGEVIDVDALTGGFNLQIAWSTGYAAGRAAALDGRQ